MMELIISMAVIGAIFSLILVAWSALRSSSKDLNRLDDMKKIQMALQNYFIDEGEYPDNLTFGSPLMGSTSSSTYMQKIPNNPLPRTEGGCPDRDYAYTRIKTWGGRNGYYINFCLSRESGSLEGGEQCLTEKGLTNDPDLCPKFYSSYPGLVLWLNGADKDAFYSDTSCSIIAETGEEIACWKDKSGQNNHALQSTASSRPILDDQQIGVFPDLSLQSDDYLVINNEMEIGTICMVANYNYLSFNNYEGLFTRNTVVDGNTDLILVGNIGNVTFYGSSLVNKIHINGVETSNFSPMLSHKIVCATLNSPVTWPDVAIGLDRAIPGRSWDGHLVEVLVFNRILPDEERRDIEDYLKNKYNF